MYKFVITAIVKVKSDLKLAVETYLSFSILRNNKIFLSVLFTVFKFFLKFGVFLEIL